MARYTVAASKFVSYILLPQRCTITPKRKSLLMSFQGFQTYKDEVGTFMHKAATYIILTVAQSNTIHMAFGMDGEGSYSVHIVHLPCYKWRRNAVHCIKFG